MIIYINSYSHGKAHNFKNKLIGYKYHGQYDHVIISMYIKENN